MDGNQFDVIVIGAGHNGLTAANYLAMGGSSVCVLERHHIVGGAAVSEEFHPGYRNSIASYAVSLLRPEVVTELELKKYGYHPMPLTSAFYPDSKGKYLLLTEDENHNQKQYATPVKGLFLCGSGAHPGGGVTGAPGRNAAKRILKDIPALK